jgi:GT2 family glycosyltransferase/glycosyltransferase involved in cell wall biosynthesis
VSIRALVFIEFSPFQQRSGRGVYDLKILFVTYGLPEPPQSGARLRDFNLVTRLADRHEVSVLSLLEFPQELERAPRLTECCARIDGVPARGAVGSAAGALAGWFRGRPLATGPYYHPELARRIAEMTRTGGYDIVQFEHSFFAPYRRALGPGFTGSTVLSLHNIGVQQYRSMLDTTSGTGRIPAALKWWLMRDWEAAEASRFDQAIVVSGEDRTRLLEMGAACPVQVIENGVDCDLLRPLPPPTGPDPEILFVGTFGYPPNRDAVRYFHAEIFPRIRAGRPKCRFIVAGSGGERHLADLTEPGVVEVTGRVEDLTGLYARASVAVVPLRSGGGSRLKVLEAMALGRPVVSTSLGREGLRLEAPAEIRVADEPAAFAGGVLDLLENGSLWCETAAAARRRVQADYDWNHIAGRQEALYRELRERRTGGGGRTKRAPADSVTPPRLSVVVPVFNMQRDLRRCLDALETSTLPDFELILVDDASTDESTDDLQNRCDRFVRLEENRGQAAARNLGAGLARAELVFFLDADVLVRPDTLERVCEVLEGNPDISAMFCSYQYDTTETDFVSRYKNLLHHFTHKISNREAVTFCGGFGAIRKAVFEEVGGFDEQRRAMEDVDLGYRLHRSGHRIRLCPWIQLTHMKRYTLASLVRADVFQRAVPWTRIMLERKVIQNDLNTRSNAVASVALTGLMLLLPLLLFGRPLLLAWLEAGLLSALVILNGRFLAYAIHMRGFWFGLRCIPMLWFQYIYSGVGLVFGVLAHLTRRWSGRRDGK